LSNKFVVGARRLFGSSCPRALPSHMPGPAAVPLRSSPSEDCRHGLTEPVGVWLSASPRALVLASGRGTTRQLIDGKPPHIKVFVSSSAQNCSSSGSISSSVRFAYSRPRSVCLVVVACANYTRCRSKSFAEFTAFVSGVHNMRQEPFLWPA